jgi:hypothetical protein
MTPGYVPASYVIKAGYFLLGRACLRLCQHAGADGCAPIVSAAP